MPKVTINGHVYEFEIGDAPAFIKAVNDLDQKPPGNAPPAAAQPKQQQVAPQVDTERKRLGRPPVNPPARRNASLENAIRVVEIIAKDGKVSFDHLVSEFGFASSRSICGFSSSIQRAVIAAGHEYKDAFIQGVDGKDKVWLATPNTPAVLSSLRANLKSAPTGA